MLIRFATPDDAETIHDFICELAEYEREPDAVEVTPETLRAQVGDAFECLLAEADGPVGFALFFHNYSTWRGKRGLYLEDLYVTPAARGRGIGKALFERLGAIARERDCARMEWSVLDWNEPAIRFYEALGAKPMTGWSTWRLSDEGLNSL